MLSEVTSWSPYLGRTAIASNGRVTLTSAFADAVRCLSGFSPYELPQIFAAPEDYGENDACRDLVRLDAEQLAERFVTGNIATYARPLSGGEIVGIDRTLWEIDDPLPRFATGVLNFDYWADSDALPTHHIFVDSEQFDLWLAGLKPFGPLTIRQLEDVTDPQVRAARYVAARSVGHDVNMDDARTMTETASAPPGAGPLLLTIKEVQDIVGQSRSTIYARMKAGEFPESIKLGNSTRWKRIEVLAWIEEQAARRGR